MITNMLSEVQSEFVLLRDEANQNRLELHQLVELIRALAEREEEKRQTTIDTKPSAGQSNESWMHWIGRTTYVISVYRYFVPRGDWYTRKQSIFSDIEFI